MAQNFLKSTNTVHAKLFQSSLDKTFFFFLKFVCAIISTRIQTVSVRTRAIRASRHFGTVSLTINEQARGNMESICFI